MRDAHHEKRMAERSAIASTKEGRQGLKADEDRRSQEEGNRKTRRALAAIEKRLKGKKR